MENKESYKVQATKFSEEGQHRLSGELFYYPAPGHANWEFTIHENHDSEILWQGNLQELIELVLLGKVRKDELIAESGIKIYKYKITASGHQMLADLVAKEMSEYPDDVKLACTDALKKCVSKLGIDSNITELKEV